MVKEDDHGPTRTIIVGGNPQQLSAAQREIEDIVNGVGYVRPDVGFDPSVSFSLHFPRLTPSPHFISILLVVLQKQSECQKTRSAWLLGGEETRSSKFNMKQDANLILNSTQKLMETVSSQSLVLPKLSPWQES